MFLFAEIVCRGGSPAGMGPIGTLDLDGCIALAMENNPDLKRQDIELERCRKEAALQLTDWFPSVNAYIGNDFNWGRSVDMQELLIIDNRMNCTATVSASATMSLSDKAARHFERKGMKCAVKAAAASVRETAAQVISDVTEAYLNLLLAEQIHEAARRNAEDMELRLRDAAAKAAAGKMNVSELDVIKARTSGERAAAMEARERIRTARIALCNCLGLPPERDFVIISPSDNSIQEPDTFRLKAIADTYASPATEAAEASLTSRKASLKAAGWSMVPAVTVSGGYGTYYGNTGKEPLLRQLSANGNPSLCIGVSIPLLEGSARFRSINDARAAVACCEAELEKCRRNDRAMAASDASKAVCLYYNLIAAQRKMEAMEAAYRAAGSRYDGGSITNSEFLLSRNELHRAEAECLQARFTYLLHLKIIEYRYGTSVAGGAF